MRHVFSFYSSKEPSRDLFDTVRAVEVGGARAYANRPPRLGIGSELTWPDRIRRVGHLPFAAQSI
jgi:hypothetical protein